MMNKIIKALKENPKVSDYLIDEVETESSQAFYVLQKLETTRIQKTKEYSVTVYHQHQEDNVDYLGSSTFQISHKLRKSELEKLIDEAVFAASFIKNKSFELVKAEKKKTWKEKDYEVDAFELIDKIAKLFFNEASAKIKFNSLEIFCTKTTNHLVNSQGVNYKKTLNKINVEAIPSYDGEDEKVELYQYYTYNKLDLNNIQNDAIQALKDVETRYKAKKNTEKRKIDIILKDQEVANFFSSLIRDYSYQGVYKQSTNKKIGDLIQKDPLKDLVTISLIPSSKGNSFDRDGIILEPIKVVEQGKLVNFYGDNQYAQYLNIKPSGVMRKIKVEKGKQKTEKLMKKPHLEIVSLSGIQIDMYSNYIGGEVRLANYFDGENYYPLSGFSFSGNIENCLKTLILSKEAIDINDYQGPKYLKLADMEII